MGDKTKIPWTDATWNPVTGCTPVSSACDHCYAARMIGRGLPKMGHEGPFSHVQFHPSRLDQPLRWKKPRRIFVCSMGDLFHEQVAMAWVDDVRRTISKCQQHTFMVLTKRPERMKEYFTSEWYRPPINLWLGVTAENQEMADLRIPILLQTPAAKRFVSVEPCLGPVDLTRIKIYNGVIECAGGRLPPVDWIIAGGESGPGARPMHPNWPRSLRDQCQAAGVPFFFKQWGEWSPEKPVGFHRVTKKRYSHESDTFLPNGMRYRSDHPDDFLLSGMETMWRVGKKAAGRLLDGREWNQFPEVTR